MRLLLVAALTGCLFALSVASVSAQEIPSWAAPPAPSFQGSDLEQPPEPPPPPPPVPVNSALALLAVAGGAYAVRRLSREA